MSMNDHFITVSPKAHICRTPRWRQHTFSLIELMLVIAIIAILLASTMGVTRMVRYKNDEAKTISFIEQFHIAMEMYKQDHGYFPPAHTGINLDIEFIKTLKNRDSGRHFLPTESLTYDEDDFVLDGWRRRFRYTSPGNTNEQLYDIESAGQDGSFGTADDINNFSRR